VGALEDMYMYLYIYLYVYLSIYLYLSIYIYIQVDCSELEGALHLPEELAEGDARESANLQNKRVKG